eukprot:4974590-Prymnesium_polylepis.1
MSATNGIRPRGLNAIWYPSLHQKAPQRSLRPGSTSSPQPAAQVHNARHQRPLRSAGRLARARVTVPQ